MNGLRESDEEQRLRGPLGRANSTGRPDSSSGGQWNDGLHLVTVDTKILHSALSKALQSSAPELGQLSLSTAFKPTAIYIKTVFNPLLM